VQKNALLPIGEKMSKKDSERIGDNELSWAWDHGLSSFLKYIVSGRQLELLTFICDTSVKYGRIVTTLQPRQFRFCHGADLGFPHWHPREIQKRRRQLKALNLIHYTYDPNNRGSPVEYIVNVGGIGLLLREVFSLGNWRGKDWRRLEDTLLSYDYTAEEFGEIDMEIDEAIKTGFSQSKKGMERRKAKKMVRLMRPADIRPWMMDCCDEYEVKYRDEGWGEDDKTGNKKVWGSAKNFLTYCKRSDVDPRELLRNVCRWWGFFQTTMKREDNKEIHLPPTVSFWKFFQYRWEIESWLDTNVARLEARAAKPAPKIRKSKLKGG
jgi:hypothetical protein